MSTCCTTMLLFGIIGCPLLIRLIRGELLSITENGFLTQQNISLLRDLAQVLNSRGVDVNATVEHTGGGLFGVEVKLDGGQTLLCGILDEQWVADYFDSDGELIKSAVLGLPGDANLSGVPLALIINAVTQRLPTNNE